MKKIGILGGGQLGRMLLQSAIDYPVITYILENDPECPSAHLCHHFTEGDIRDFHTFYEFGKNLDVITIEIESVNVEALEKLEQEGVLVIPKTSVLKTIRDKVLQKQYYLANNIHTADFRITQHKEEVALHEDLFPAVHKIGQGGYDGKGVQVLKTPKDCNLGFDGPSVLEKMVKIKKEIAQIIAVAVTGEVAVFPPVEMVFDPSLNLLDFQLCPANISESTLQEVERLSMSVVKGFNSPGLFAVELFEDECGQVYVNETAPRVHNSGHHSIEGNHCSQFDMLWRILLQLPLGDTSLVQPSILVNIIGDAGFSGDVFYEGLEQLLSYPKTYCHLYGKKTTKPGRKMGHFTILGESQDELIKKAHHAKTVFRVISH